MKSFAVSRNHTDNSSHNKGLYKLHRTIVAIIILSIALVIAASYFNNFQMLVAQMNMPSTSMNMNMSSPIDYNSTKFITYKNSSLGIQVLHPVSWKPVEKSTFRGQVVEFIPVVENELIQQKGYATTVEISNYLNVSSPSVMNMVKRLNATGSQVKISATVSNIILIANGNFAKKDFQCSLVNMLGRK